MGWVPTFPKRICMKVNVITRLEFELANIAVIVLYFSHYVMEAKAQKEYKARHDWVGKVIH